MLTSQIQSTAFVERAEVSLNASTLSDLQQRYVPVFIPKGFKPKRLMDSVVALGEAPASAPNYASPFRVLA